MPPEFAAALESLGWLLALMFAALLPGLPAMRRRSHTGWLIAFCATRLLVAAQGLVSTSWSGETRELVAILCGMLLWEYARRVWNDTHARRVSAATHVVAVECFALILAANAAAGWTATLGWLLPVTILVATLPIALGGAAVLLLWRCFDDRALRLAVVGLGLFGVGAAAGPIAIVGAIAPWLAVTGLAGVCFSVATIRGRVAFVWMGGLLVTFAGGPLVIAQILRGIETDQHAELLDRVQQSVASLQGRAVAGLDAEGAPGIQTRAMLQEHLKNLRRSDALFRDVSVWKLRGNRRLTLDLTDGSNGRWIDHREAAPTEAVQATGLRPFIVRAGERVVVHGPLQSSSLETPVAWLTLDYPEAFWSLRRDHARRNGVGLIGIFAGFCAMGFVLSGRQAIENAQRIEIERVQAADKAKTEFLAFLGHELRTPLQTILGRAELLRGQPDAARHAAAIENQGQLLLRLVTDLLDLGMIEAGRFELRPQSFSLRALVRAIEADTRPLADAAGLAFVTTVDAAVPDALIGDEMRLRQILANLLGNAVKYTPTGRVSLAIRAEMNDDRTVHLSLQVRDTGPGLAAEKIPQLFTLFTRLDSGATFTREGTGVGLALVRRLCSLMGGTVTAANHPEGGAEFTVQLALPLANPDELSSAKIPAQSVTPALAVLIAEDNTATRELLSEALTFAGHDVVAVGDGEGALAAANARAFDVAVLDINLPRRDGVAVARLLRARYPKLRIVGCSAEALPAMRDTALAAGMNELLVKPVSLDSLVRAISVDGSTPTDESVFGRLRSVDSKARIRAGLGAEWRQLWSTAEKSHAAGDSEAFGKCAHYLQSSALLLGDEALLELCHRLSAAGAETEGAEARARLLAEFERHLNRWPGETSTGPGGDPTLSTKVPPHAEGMPRFVTLP